ncbi:oxidoreductase [Microbispora rosea subsp. aerata]|nr:aldo/keto reductase [Microbispora rosea]GGO20192.1 oxidoreductase [Microbispora rosea subsp. aerata]GIH57093.1 oxidoreductase [Microbispora rosea subsp. aerata]GLJ83550.1 oxidoreductase [Microbispora rosea subsp. aerata]
MDTTTAAASGHFLLGGDLRVNRLGFGAMRLALGGSARTREAGVAVLRRAVELGVNHIDTAGFYGFGDLHAHELIREALSPYPDDLVIATKVGPLLEGGVVPTGQARPDQLRGLVEDDLRRLGRDHLDLVYLRVGGMGPAGGEPIGERFAVLAELRREGLIRHLGVSNVDAAQLAEARSIAPVAAVQNHFHVHHTGDRDVLATCEREGIAYVPYFPLGGGPQRIDHARLADVAARHGATTAQIALAWLLATSPVTLPIPGTGSLDHLTENVGAAAIRLTDGDLAELG